MPSRRHSDSPDHSSSQKDLVGDSGTGCYRPPLSVVLNKVNHILSLSDNVRLSTNRSTNQLDLSFKLILFFDGNSGRPEVFSNLLFVIGEKARTVARVWIMIEIRFSFSSSLVYSFCMYPI